MRLLPVVRPGVAGPYTFIKRETDGVPVTWDPCRPIHYVINPRGSLAGGTKQIKAAVASISAATGLRFVYDGFTKEGFARNRHAYLPGVYGDRWAPLLFVWTTPTVDPGLAGHVVGEGGSVPVSIGDNPPTFVSGTVALDAPELVKDARSGALPILRPVLLHELGHVVGLDHVSDKRQIMAPSTDGVVTSYGKGDRAGLAAVGAGRCAPEL